MLVFNDIDLSAYLVIKSIRRSITAPQDIVSLNIPNKPGSKFVRREIRNIILVLEVTIISDSREGYLENVEIVAEILSTDEPKKLELYDDDNRYYMGILSGPSDLNTLKVHGDAVLNFICEPYKYGSLKGTTGTALINNGTVETYDWRTTITFTGAGSNVTISIGSDDLVINQAVVSTDVMIIDFKLRTVKLNGTLIMDKVSLASDFFAVPIGSSTLTVTGATHTKLTQYQEFFK